MNSKILILILISLFSLSCKNREKNYIDYYNQVNRIDSINRIAKQSKTAIKQYKKLFRKYEPKNQDRINEFETYVMLSDHYRKNFGGKKSLYKLIELNAPNWKYKKYDTAFIKFYQKYGIDSLNIELKVNDWKKNLNRKLVDSFSVAFKRDQESRRQNNPDLMKLNDRKNIELFLWTFEHYGFPSQQKIGLYGNNEVFMPMSNILLHMVDEKEFELFKHKMYQYVKSGDCPPKEFGAMVDRNLLQIKNTQSIYGLYESYDLAIDSTEVDKNRKKIGVPSFYHSKFIYRDFVEGI